MNKCNKFLVILNLAIVGIGCYDGNDLRSTQDAPKPRPPEIGHAPDGGAPAAVEEASRAIIGPGMRSCYVSPYQTAGEVAILRWMTGTEPPGQSQQCLLLALSQWDVCSPTLHWYDGTMLNDNIRQVQGYAYDRTCIKVTLWPEWQFGGTPTVHKACAGPFAYQNLYVQPPATTSSIKTEYYACPNYPDCP